VRQKIWLMIEELQSHPPPNLPLEGEEELSKFFLESRGSKVSAYAPKGRGKTTFEKTELNQRRMIMPKAKSIYIFGGEPQAGKSVVLLGIMELLSRRSVKINVI